jgi:single-stranded-DNA-specific exonuclease
MARAQTQTHVSASPRGLQLPVGVDAPEVTIPGVSAAAREIADTLRAGHRVAVFCDYDPDGTCAGETLRLALVSHVDGVSYDAQEPGQLLFGYANATKGFGLDIDFVEAAAAGGAHTLVTVDCGSASSAAVARAQELGMVVVVSDHHQIASDNSAEHHLNPALHGVSAASGSVVAYKLAVALAQELDGGLTARLRGRGAVVAAFGARSDWMPMSGAENQALADVGRDVANIPPGLTYMASALGYSNVEQAFTALDELLNLPKRTPRARALWSALVLAADNPEAAQTPTAQLLALKATSEAVLAAMLAQAQTVVESTDVRVARARVRVSDGEDFTGHAGNVAHELNLLYQQPAVVFIYAGEDAQGNELWRWAARNGEGPNTNQSFTDSLAAIRAASTIPTVDGPISSAGGHPRAVSGKCGVERIDAVVAAFEDWARTRSTWQE